MAAGLIAALARLVVTPFAAPLPCVDRFVGLVATVLFAATYFVTGYAGVRELVRSRRARRDPPRAAHGDAANAVLHAMGMVAWVGAVSALRGQVGVWLDAFAIGALLTLSAVGARRRRLARSNASRTDLEES